MKVAIMMEIMQVNIGTIVSRGQNEKKIAKLLGSDAITTIIMGSMRMVVLKWKLSGNKSNLVGDGKSVLNGILRMIEK